MAVDQQSITLWNTYVSIEEPSESWEVESTKELWKYDFEKGQYLCLQSTDYHPDGSSSSAMLDDKWQYPIPGSIGEAMFEYARNLHKESYSKAK